MNSKIVNFKHANMLYELGFNKPCMSRFVIQSNEKGIGLLKEFTFMQNMYPSQICSAPRYSQAFEFFEESYKLEVLTDLNTMDYRVKQVMLDSLIQKAIKLLKRQYKN